MKIFSYDSSCGRGKLLSETPLAFIAVKLVSPLREKEILNRLEGDLSTKPGGIKSISGQKVQPIDYPLNL